MDDTTTRILLPALGSLLAGFLGGAAAWFATNYWGRPISKFLELRLQAQETILFGSDSLLMQFGRRLALVSRKESTSCGKRFDRPHWSRAVLSWTAPVVMAQVW